ncbi:hypothetical protein BN946_scf185008.g99 [Trametes cinnabarina]|uniref:BTB domain-containing protein n=1 Tax=Pycnoporus cinnabarinus TaxID=5643 RepID=A0A060SGP3_PYCCI|nr:hypothetical protein BN946_scf185008.g99 [Trametes cinnabarina]
MAPHPFNKPDGDVILRTSDNVEFRVRSHILIEASPVFEKMLARRKSSAESDTSASRRVIDLTEDSTTTETWLLLIYPVFQDPSFWSRMDLLKAQAVLHATAEYQILAVQSAIAHYLSRKASSGNSRRRFVIWAIACRHRLEELAATAASHMTLRDARPAILPLDDLEHLEGISAGDYHRLLHYHRESGKVDQEYRFLQDPSPKQEPRVPYIPVQVPSPNLICRSSDVVDISRSQGTFVCGITHDSSEG